MTLSVDDLPEEKCSPVTEAWDVSAELVSGVGLSNRSGSGWHLVAHQKADAVGAPQRGGVEAKLDGQLLVEHEEAEIGKLLGLPGNSQLRKLTCKAVVKSRDVCGRDAHVFQTTRPHAEGPGAQTWHLRPVIRRDCEDHERVRGRQRIVRE